LVVIRSALWAFAPWVGWPGRPAKVAGGLLRAEEGIQQAGVVRLRRNHLVLQTSPQTSELLAARPSPLGRVDRGDQQQGRDKAEPSGGRQQPALRIAADGLAEHRDLAGGGVLPDQVGHHHPAGHRQHEQNECGHWPSSNVASPEPTGALPAPWKRRQLLALTWSAGRAGEPVLPGDGGPLAQTSTEQHQALAWIHRSIANSVESLQASRPSEAGWRFT
jgi:hypothetical protein